MGNGAEDGGGSGLLVTSDGKTLLKNAWGALPSVEDMEGEKENEESSEEGEGESSDEDMDASDEEGEEVEHKEAEKENIETITPGTESVLPQDGMESVVPNSSLELRKRAGEETPMLAPPKQLYTVLEQTSANKEKQAGAVFTSDVAYVLPGSNNNVSIEGAESVLSKAIVDDSGKRKRAPNKDEEEEADNLGKKFKF